MTVLERLKAAGYDPAVSLFPDSIGNAGSMECERIQIRTFFCRPRENEAAIGVTATAMIRTMRSAFFIFREKNSATASAAK